MGKRIIEKFENNESFQLIRINPIGGGELILPATEMEMDRFQLIRINPIGGVRDKKDIAEEINKVSN